ncbi:MAG TPA: hypothetical protein VLJ68_00985 [Chitinophagaceae bacterium]|nr:hypothetical protein [Chitinophagaceae bacterium]
MQKLLSSVLLLAIIGNDYPIPGKKADAGPAPEYKWTELTSHAAFPKSYNFRLLSIRDTLWAFHAAGNWYSLDGKTWTKSSLTNSIGNLAFLDYVVFKNAVYGLGHFDGNIEKYSLTSPIYKSTDLKKWTVLANNSNLPKRFFYHPFVFNEKIWIIGGGNGITKYADIWNSTDAVHWTQQADHLPFGKRQGSQFVVFHNRIYMLNNDVWSSADGIAWKKETNEIYIGESIFGYASVVYDDKIWLLGCNRNGKFKSEILVSSNGKDWTTQHAPWTPRGGIAATIHNGKIFMTGGKYGGPGIAGQTEFVYSNDVWSLEK